METATRTTRITFTHQRSAARKIGTVAKKTKQLRQRSPSPAKEKKNPAHNQVRIVPISEYKEAAQTLAEAFWEDDVGRYCVDTPENESWTDEQKWECHRLILEYFTAMHCMKGMVTTIGPNYDAIAMWAPPNSNVEDPITYFRSGMWRLNYQLKGEAKARFFREFLPLLHDTKTSVLGERDNDSWYLVYLGTKKSSRGKGYARKLIEHVTEMADAGGQVCYLESSNCVNLPFYGRMGFEIVRKIYLQRGAKPVDLDIMVREPLSKQPKEEEVEYIDEKLSLLSMLA